MGEPKQRAPREDLLSVIANLARGCLPTFFLGFIHYGVCLSWAAKLMGRDQGGPWSNTSWVAFVVLHLTLWVAPFLLGAMLLRREYGRFFLVGMLLALVAIAALDGGHTVRRAYIGKF